MFEVHITVNAIEQQDIPDFVEFCQTIEAKPIIIELEKGIIAQQPMISKVYRNIEKHTLKNELIDLLQDFKTSIYAVNRVKVEVPLFFIKEGLLEFPSYKGQYFEWHGKVKYEDLETLKQKIKYLDVHLSRNSLKGQSNLRFLTKRTFWSKDHFINNVTETKDALARNEIELVKEEYEYCIYDSNKSIDKGWIDTPEITDDRHLNLLAFEGFLRRASEHKAYFILKGSLLTRQCIANRYIRMANDIDFVYGNYLEDEIDANRIFSDWVTEVTETMVKDDINFRSFRENNFWRGIDYAMNDDFPTTNTDLYCEVKGQVLSAMGLDITWNLPIEETPVPLLYHPVEGEPFTIPYTIPIPLQISWKLHQSMVRPRAKDLVDIILFLEDNELSEDELERTALYYVKECIKDRIDPKRILHYSENKVSTYFQQHEKEVEALLSSYADTTSKFGFRIGYDLDFAYLKQSFKVDFGYTKSWELILHFEQILSKYKLAEYVIKHNSEIWNR